jgi:phosphoribosylaminoimidazolecarboxamide formyltransferase/IMP cyclohydrolase
MIRRALLSVSDKTGLIPFARELAARGVQLLSTGGTQKALQAEGIPVTPVEEYTGSPEVMAGRVKTLHPKIHGGLLQRGDVDADDLARLGASPIDLVVVNLYPFETVVQRLDARLEDLIENIDIGGPSMLRSAAKNHERVTVVCDPSDYERVLGELRDHAGATLPATRRMLAAKVFARTAAYDAAIASYLSSIPADADLHVAPERAAFPRALQQPYEQVYSLRYGENPHQKAAFYRERDAVAGSIAFAAPVTPSAKELSFNNLVDLDAALEAVKEFETPAAVVVKHTNPCGVARAATLEAAYRAAREADPVSAFGGIVALNREVDEATAKALAETFLECIVAPSFSAGAAELLAAKKNLRVLACGAWQAGSTTLTSKRVSGGLVVQTVDATGPGEVTRARVVTKRAPTPAELAALDFAWLVCKHVKSNAIVLAGPDATLGVGAGQMSRVESVRIACSKAGDRTRGAALASDAFFPFPDGLELAVQAGVTAIAQPGGSVKDEEVIAKADALGAAMVFTGVRHFRH